jgi:hypothetical protein
MSGNSFIVSSRLYRGLLREQPKRQITYHHADGGPGEDTHSALRGRYKTRARLPSCITLRAHLSAKMISLT